MTITGALVDNEGVILLVDREASLDEHRFQHQDGLWWSEKDGLVVFFFWTGPGNEGGFGGEDFNITMVDGTLVTLRGPWSSRPGLMNKRGFPPSMGVRIRAAENEWWGNALVSAVRRWTPVTKIPAEHFYVAPDEPTWAASASSTDARGVLHAAYCLRGITTLCGCLLSFMAPAHAPTCLWCAARKRRDP